MVRSKGTRVTIADIAVEAGVSKGTVDRVIHNRGLVAPKVKERILEVIDRLNYKPNIYASLLASNREYRFACLLPEYSKGDYWESIHKGIESGKAHSLNLGVTIDTYTFNSFEPEQFLEATDRVVKSRPDAVIFAPNFRDISISFTEELTKLNIPYIYIDSKIDSSNYLAYFGMPIFDSGKLGASILTKRRNVKDIAYFKIDRQSRHHNNSTVLRESGFLEYIDRTIPNCNVVEVLLHPTDQVKNRETLKQFFIKHSGIDHLITFNSKAYVIAQYILDSKIEDKILIGYDTLAENIRLLKSGQIDYLVTLQPERQALQAIVTMCEHIVLKRRVKSETDFMQMDIVSKESIDYYNM